ncbi:MAG TPA: LamG domain-containing protein, partial [Candidatus Absconditabacterales bacterium]|nr:LamG domain-containing protein [Candidatus Absconditabacterales bacterium]
MEKIKKISYGTVIKVAITIAIFSQIIIQSISSKSTFAQEAEITQTTETVSLPEQTITVYEQTDTPPPTYEEKSQTITVYETENSQPTVTSFDISTSENGSGDSLNNTTINSPLEITGSIITGENQEREIITNEFGSGDLGNSIELSGKNNESLIDDTDNKEISLITKDRTTEINTGEEIEEDTNILDFYNEMDFPGTDCIVTEPCTGNNFKSQNKNFFKENNKIKKNIRTKYSQGIITESIDLVSDDETIKIKINAGTKALTRERKAYQGIIYKPETIETTSYPDENNNIFKTIKVKTDENIDFIDKIDMTPKTVQITSTVDSIFLGNTIDVFFSEDNGETRSHQTTTEAKEQDGETTISFNTTHFTIFSFGLSTGSFVINNDATTATGFNVTLQNNVTGATLMKFGNTPAARDAANWTGYSSSFNWTLTGTDELKTVYAAFSNSGGTTAFTTDRIYLDTNSVVMASGLIRHITSSNSGAVFFDSSTNGDNATGFGGYTVTTLGAESIVNFNGTNAYLQRNDQIVTAFPFTIGARVRPSRLSGVQRIAGLARSSANNRYRGIGLNGNKASVILRNTLESITNSSSSLVTGQRYYIVGVFNSTTDIRLYVNGISEATASPLVTFSSNAANVVSIGRQSTSTPTRYFSGAIDETRVYNINLPVPRIQLLSALTGTFQTLTTNNDSPTLSGT